MRVSVYTTILPEIIQEEVNAGRIPKKKKKKNPTIHWELSAFRSKYLLVDKLNH